MEINSMALNGSTPQTHLLLKGIKSYHSALPVPNIVNFMIFQMTDEDRHFEDRAKGYRSATNK